MSNGRNLTSWLLLGLLTVVALGAAVLGIAQSPKNAPLTRASPSNRPQCTGGDQHPGASNYSEVLNEVTPQGKQTDYLVYQAPDRLGGYIQSGNRRTYVYVIGKWEYQSLTVAVGASTDHLTFYRQASQGAQALDPAHGYLPYAKQAKNITKSGDTYTFTLSETTAQGKQTGQVRLHRLGSLRLGVQPERGHRLGQPGHLPGGHVAPGRAAGRLQGGQSR